MRHYRHNARWLLWFAPFRVMSVSAAYLVPFFVEHGLNTAEIFLLQAIFSAVYLLWEIPSGVVADRLGRARAIKLSAPIAALALIAYGFSDHFWQFVLCELALAIASGLISGVDTALLVDSLKADRREKEYVRLAQRIEGMGYLAVAASVPLAIALVHLWGTRATLVADGLLLLLGMSFAMRLVEAPQSEHRAQEVRQTFGSALRDLLSDADARWLIILSSTLSTATYLTFWLSAIYYQGLGIPTILFGAILAVRSLWKAGLSHRFHQERNVGRNMFWYAGLAGAVYLAMATGQLWLVWAVLAHDLVQALSTAPLTRRINAHIASDHRAGMNSVVNMARRLAYTIAGPLVGLTVDKFGLTVGLIATGVTCSSLAYLAVWRLHQLRALR